MTNPLTHLLKELKGITEKSGELGIGTHSATVLRLIAALELAVEQRDYYLHDTYVALGCEEDMARAKRKANTELLKKLGAKCP